MSLTMRTSLRGLLSACLLLAATACGGESATLDDAETGGTSGASGASGASGGKAGSSTGGAGAAGSAGSAGSSAGGAAAGGAGGEAAGGAGGAGSGGSGQSGEGGAPGGQGGEAGAGGEAGQSGEAGQGGSPAAEVIKGSKVRVATFNIRTGNADKGTKNSWENRKALLFDVFKDLEADFIGVQEAQFFQLQDIDAAAPGYDRIGVASDDAKKVGENTAIYYRKGRYAVKDDGHFWLSDTPDKPSQSWNDKFNRIVTWGRFEEKSSGYQLYIYNAHWGLTELSAERSAVLMMKRIDQRATDHPFFVTGDLNTRENEPPIRFLKGNATINGNDNPLPLRDTFRVLYPDETQVRTAHGFNGGTDGAKIDYVFINLKNPDVTGAQIVHTHKGDLYPSDHYPVVATVKMPDQKK